MIPQSDLVTCESLQDIQAYTGQRVMTVGIYIQVDLRMRKKGRPKYTGYAAVRLTDGTEVLLEPSWSTAAIRSADERRQFENDQVEVIGTVHLQTPKAPEEVAYVMGPCITPVERIQLAQQETAL